MIVLPEAVRESMVTHAESGAPREVCGVLGGEDKGERSVVKTVHRAENVADDPRTTYAIGPEEQLEIMTAVEDAGHEVVGFYHSHPAGPSGPSETDAARATWAGYCYVIVDLGGASPSVGAWRWTGDRFEEQQVRLD